MRPPRQRPPAPTRTASRALAVLPLAALLLAALLPLAPGAAAHVGGHSTGPGFPHVNPMRLGMVPGEAHVVDLANIESTTGDGKFEAGWVFTVSAEVPPGSAPVAMALHQGHGGRGAPVAQWTLPGPGAHTLTGPMPATDLYSLNVSHGGGAGTANVTWFYDNSCNCIGKPIPVEVTRGLVVFNADVAKGATWRATFPEPGAHRLEVSLAQRTGAASRWPEDFRVLHRSAEPVVRDAGVGPARLHEITWTADEGGRHYFFVQATSTNRTAFDPRQGFDAVFVTPHYEQLAAAPAKPAPLGAEALLAPLAAAALALAARRRRA